MSERIDLAQFFGEHRVSSASLGNGWRIDVLYWKITKENHEYIPNRRRFSEYLYRRFGEYTLQILSNVVRSDEETLVICYPDTK